MTVSTKTETTKSNKTSTLPPEDLKVMPRTSITFGPLGIARIIINLFSTNPSSSTAQRDPPSKYKTKHIRLITILPSPFCEKIRWIFDLLEARDDNPYYYTEDAHPPGFHSFETLTVSNYEASQTPMIVYNKKEEGDDDDDKDDDDGGEICWLTNSNLIVEKFLPEMKELLLLYPNDIKDDIQQLEIDIGKRISTAGRCFVYYHTLNNLDKYKDTIVNTCAKKECMSNVEHVLFNKMIDKGLGKGILQGVHVTKDTYDASCIAIRNIFHELSTKLEKSKSNGGEYLMDTSTKKYGFTIADLTFAASSAMLLLPPETKSIYGDINSNIYPPEYIQLRNELLQTTAGKHVLNIYKKHRGGVVAMKIVNRNKYPWQTSSFPRSSSLAIMGGVAAAATVAIAAVAVGTSATSAGGFGVRSSNN